MRLDLLLVRLRFSRSRGIAQRWIAEGHIRCDGARVTSAAHAIETGCVLTLPIGRSVQVVRITALPVRRGPAAEARSHYEELDPRQTIAIAGAESRPDNGEQEGPSLP